MKQFSVFMILYKETSPMGKRHVYNQSLQPKWTTAKNEGWNKTVWWCLFTHQWVKTLNVSMFVMKQIFVHASCCILQVCKFHSCSTPGKSWINNYWGMVWIDFLLSIFNIASSSVRLLQKLLYWKQIFLCSERLPSGNRGTFTPCKTQLTMATVFKFIYSDDKAGQNIVFIFCMGHFFLLNLFFLDH